VYTKHRYFKNKRRKRMGNQKSLKISFLILTAGLLIFTPTLKAEVAKEILSVKGLGQSVEIIKDRWGISHIYAQNQHDLFFAQGFNVARDRLFQLEIWRRQATGTLAEILGKKALQKDIGAHLLKARVEMKKELNHYHPQGEEIITAFVQGINAYVDLTRQNPNLLPIEFELLGIKPNHWTPEVVVSRHNGLFRNVRTEISLAKVVNLLGADKVKSLLNLHPDDPGLVVEEGIDLSQISSKILDIYNSGRSRVKFGPEDIAKSSPIKEALKSNFNSLFQLPWAEPYPETDLGSNNWVISGRLSFTRHPMMANDPHRTQQVPSLRYWVHLNAPGWNVIGGGEPALPGISIGHNEYGAWGLTIFAIDQEDLYVYQTNPKNPNQYFYQRKWEEMKVIQEKIPVKGESDFKAELKFTHHGPVLLEDTENHRAYALRAAWLEIGSAPYLASLRMDQARNWQEFREACSYSNTPSENMVWADVEGNIGWQAVGIAPRRKNWNGLLPVPGNGKFEWSGFIPIKKLPHDFNPSEGFIATANQDNIPPGYPYSLGFLWTDPYRFARTQEFLGSGRKLTMMDMMKLQQDVLSIPARCLVPLLQGLESKEPTSQKAIEMLLSWDHKLSKDSVEAALYTRWERRLFRNVWNLYLPEEARNIFPRRSLKKTIDWLTAPDGHFGLNPTAGRDALLLKSMEQAVDDLVQRLGPDMQKWQYGQEKLHHIKVHHLLSEAVNPELQAKLDVGPLPRGGNSYTVNNTTNNYNQTSGASFRIIADTNDWDNSVGTNSPGQSGDPKSPHYSDLFKPWAEGKYFPVFFSRSKIESAAESITFLKPKN
jgi:penicillin amidase